MSAPGQPTRSDHNTASGRMRGYPRGLKASPRTRRSRTPPRVLTRWLRVHIEIRVHEAAPISIVGDPGRIGVAAEDQKGRARWGQNVSIEGMPGPAAECVTLLGVDEKRVRASACDGKHRGSPGVSLLSCPARPSNKVVAASIPARTTRNRLTNNGVDAHVVLSDRRALLQDSHVLQFGGRVWPLSKSIARGLTLRETSRNFTVRAN